MQSQTQTRKRPAPGASPMMQQPQSQQQGGMNFASGPDANSLPADPYFNWNDTNLVNAMDSGYGDAQMFDTNAYPSTFNGPVVQGSGQRVRTEANTQLVRRNTNQQLAARAAPFGPNTWRDFNRQSVPPQQGWDGPDEDEEDLDQKARQAKAEAMASRKQIPPFVQKLSSFLNEDKNTDLIRWSDDGKSFLVVDEDEFAKTLIPELFKHNNYASFVRQLNMYGFHKKVGLSDNSMNTSIEKKKTPSEYYNKYFQRGRPDLLWLIQKPKATTGGAKRKRDEDRVMRAGDDGDATPIAKVEDSRSGDGDGGRGQELVTMPRAEITEIRTELQKLQNQQKFISNMINQIRQQNDQLYQQATAFQTLHDRHESSINAILTFLATFYNRSLEGHSVKNLTDMFAHAIPQNTQSHGNIVDMGDYHVPDIEKPSPMRRGKTQLLLPAPAPKEVTPLSGTRATSTSSTRAQTLSPRAQNQSVLKPPFQSNKVPTPTFNPSPSTSPALKNDAPTPNNLNAFPESEDVLSAINSVNANSNLSSTQGPQFDFPAALSHFQTANGNQPLTPEQRNDMLSLMANHNLSPMINGIPALSGSDNNALVSPQMPPMPSLEQYTATNDQLDLLQKLQEDTASKVQHLTDRLVPLSPTGTIPGLANGVNGNYNYPPNDFDLDTFVHTNNDDYFGDPNAAGPSDPNFNFGDLDFGQNSANTENLDQYFGMDSTTDQPRPKDHDAKGGRIVESVSSEATSPAVTVPDEDKENGDSPGSKRRKVE